MPLLRDDDPRFAQHLPMVRMWARRYFFKTKLNKTHSIGDLEAVALEALWSAIVSYDAERGASFATFAYNTIRQALSRLNEKFSVGLYRNRFSSLSSGGAAQANADGDEGEPWELPSPARTPEELTHVAIGAASLSSAIDSLSPQQRQVIAMRYGAGDSHAEIGEQLGFSKQRAKQIEDAALGALRNHFIDSAFQKARGQQ